MNTVVSVAAMASAVAIPSPSIADHLGDKVDPVFAAIEDHQRYYGEFEKASANYSKAQKHYFRLLKRKGVSASDLQAAKAASDKAEQINYDAGDRERAAFEAIWELEPTAPQSFKVWLEYMRRCADDQTFGLLLNDGALADFIQKIQRGLAL